ncbi:CMRF35-like molecule 3 [Aulostomus maculatus]
MRTLRTFPCLINAPLLFVIWLTKHTVDSDQLSAPKEVQGAHNGSVSVPCQYDRHFKDNTKYWCKGPIYDLCQIMVKTPKNRKNNRIFITDDKSAGVFTVTMTSLRISDTDMYWCVIATQGRNIHSRVRLLISHIVTTTISIKPGNSSLTTEQEGVRWWLALRWILFFTMLCFLVSVHVVVWRRNSVRK